MPRVGKVLGMSDADISTACDSCGTCQSLAEATVDESHRPITIYRCSHCAHTILIVQTRGRVPWDGIGHLIRSWIIRNPRDLLLQADQMSRRTSCEQSRTTSSPNRSVTRRPAVRSDFRPHPIHVHRRETGTL